MTGSVVESPFLTMVRKERRGQGQSARAKTALIKCRRGSTKWDASRISGTRLSRGGDYEIRVTSA